MRLTTSSETAFPATIGQHARRPFVFFFKPGTHQCNRRRIDNTSGRRGTRTPDHFLVREALYQLSYAPANGS